MRILFEKICKNVKDSIPDGSADTHFRAEINLEQETIVKQIVYKGFMVSFYDFIRLFQKRGLVETIKEQLVAEAQRHYLGNKSVIEQALAKQKNKKDDKIEEIVVTKK